MNNSATIGFFDGVHRGHQYLIGQLQTLAVRRGERPLVVTFARHPRQTLQPSWQPQLLSTPEEKRLLLLQTGVDRVEMLHFDRQMAQLSARAFMQWLHDALHVATLLTGYDNHFGHRPATAAADGGAATRAESFSDYVGYGREMGIDVVCAKPYSVAGSTVSSSRIRRLLAEGAVVEAADCLGRPYSIGGTVVAGHRIGRRLGFPTANLQSNDAQKLVPRDGVYAVTALVDGGTRLLPGMTNIGTRPTFDGTQRTIETHLLDFSGDLYGHAVEINFHARLRDERHFASAEALARQMQDDAECARRLLFPTTNEVEQNNL